MNHPTDTDPAVSQVRSFIGEQSEAGKIDREQGNWRTRLPRFPEVEFSGDKSYHWDVETSEGKFTIKFFPEVAPKHVANFVYLTELGFFDDLIFHRVIDDFMAQGGCPEGSGFGGPGYQFDGEFDPGTRHDRPGLLSMANAGPGTDGSQFFITFRHTPHLDDNHSIFGEVIEGMETIRALEANGSRSGKPSKELRISQAKIRDS